jgi:hypothetical protein
MVDDAANNLDDAAVNAAAAAEDALPRSMPPMEKANGDEGDEDDAPTALLLARFIQNFHLQISGPVVVAVVMVRRQGGHEPARSPGGC